MNPDIANAKPAVLAALRKANAVIGIGDVHGWSRPQAYTAALSMLNACREIERDVPTIPPPPQKPAGIRKWVDDAVEVRAREAVRRDVIDELVLNQERAVASAGLAAAPDTADRLSPVFDELLAQFDELSAAPRTLSGHESPEEVEAHTALLRLVGALSTTVMQRAILADAAREGEQLGEDALWLVLNPGDTATRDGIDTLLRDFKGRLPRSVDEWDTLRTIGVRLAQLGEGPHRRERHSRLIHAASMYTPDMGQKDHAYSELAELESNARGGYPLQAEQDFMSPTHPR